MPTVLVVDDEQEIRDVFDELLTASGLTVIHAGDGEEALAQIHRAAPATILLDLAMPRMGGMAVLARLREEGCAIPVVVVTADSDVPKVVDAMRLGAYDYVVKPVSVDELLLRVRNALERSALVAEVQALRRETESSGLREQMGPSAEIRKLIEQVRLVAGSNFSVLIHGETGTGKELVARAIHHQSPRRQARFVALDSGAMPESLTESELFGYERGAFTGADRRKEGYFQAATGGTLFLDEVANLSASIQGKLLRVLQEREVQALGAKHPVRVDVRIIAATNQPLDAEVRAGRFRQDLYYRLNEFTITLPPLRERRDDILPLVRRFLVEASMELKCPVRDLADDATQVLLNHSWPGNVRELKNAVRRAALLSAGTISAEQLRALDLDTPPASPGSAPPATSPAPTLSLREAAETAAARAEQEVIRQALEASRGNKSEAARLLRTDYKTLYVKLKRYGITARAPQDE